jgi:hypothetical protein
MSAYKIREAYRELRHTRRGITLPWITAKELRKDLFPIILLATFAIGPDIRPSSGQLYQFPIDGNGVVMGILGGISSPETILPSGAVHVEDIARIVVDCLKVIFNGKAVLWDGLTRYEHILTGDSRFDWNSANAIAASRFPLVIDAEGRPLFNAFGGSVKTQRWRVSMGPSLFGEMKSFSNMVGELVADFISRHLYENSIVAYRCFSIESCHNARKLPLILFFHALKADIYFYRSVNIAATRAT